MCDFIFLPSYSHLCQDGTVIVHTVRRGLFLQTLRPPSDSCVPAQISALQVGMEGHIVVQTSLDEQSNRKVCDAYSAMRMQAKANTQPQPTYVSIQTVLRPTGQVLDVCLLRERLSAGLIHHGGACDCCPLGV